jgi:hypothetical protein
VACLVVGAYLDMMGYIGLLKSKMIDQRDRFFSHFSFLVFCLPTKASFNPKEITKSNKSEQLQWVLVYGL